MASPTLSFPVATVFNTSGTYSSDQNTNVVSYWVMGQA